MICFLKNLFNNFFGVCLNCVLAILQAFKFLVLVHLFFCVNGFAEEESDESDPFGIVDDGNKNQGSNNKNSKTQYDKNSENESLKNKNVENKNLEKGALEKNNDSGQADTSYDFETSEDAESEDIDDATDESIFRNRETSTGTSDRSKNKDNEKNSKKANKDVNNDDENSGSKGSIDYEQFSSSRRENRFAIISCLNKVTAKSKEIKIAVGKTQFCGNLEVKAVKCVSIGLKKNIFVNVVEHKLNYDSQKIFGGWLISESPSISTITHPVYEVFAKSCIDK